MPTVDEQLGKHAKKLCISPSHNHEALRKKMLSFDSSPLQQVSSADDDSTTLIPSNLLSPRSSDTDTLPDEGPSDSRVFPAALDFGKEEGGDNPIWSQIVPDMSPPTSPTFSDSSLSSNTPLFATKFQAPSQSSYQWEPRSRAKGNQILSPFSTALVTERPTAQPVHNRRISLPIESNSSIDAIIRPSSISNINVAFRPCLPSSIPAQLSTEANKATKAIMKARAKSRPKRQCGAEQGDMEKSQAVSVDPWSRFSDDEDDNACQSILKKFGKCFGGRKT